MTITRAFMIGTLASALPFAAHAADFAVAPVADVYAATPAASWTGLYVGAHIGYGSGDTSIQNNGNTSPVLSGAELEDEGVDIDEELLDASWVIADCSGTGCESIPGLSFNEDDNRWEPGPGPYLDQEMDVEGMFGGLQMGYNYQMGSIVLGVVGDASVSTMSGRGGNNFDDEDGDDWEQQTITDGTINWEPMAQSNFETEINWLATLRARAGFLPTSNWLVYAHGGLAAGDVEITGVGSQGPFVEVNHSDIQVGWTAGFGTEVMMTERISLFAEYGYTDLGDADVDVQEGNGRWDISSDTSFHAVKAGINWRLTN